MNDSLEAVIDRYKDDLYRLAFSITKNDADAQEVVQHAFIRYCRTKAEFKDETHRRAWLIRVVINKSIDYTCAFWKRNRVSLEEYMELLPFEEEKDKDLFYQVIQQPQKYRLVIHLYYYEDYSIKEISELTHTKEATIRKQLSRVRVQLKNVLKGNDTYE